MPKHIVFAILGLIVGLIIGFYGANKLNDGTKSADNLPVAETIVPNNPQVHSADIKEKVSNGAIADVQKVLDRAKNEPDNGEAQIEAGDMYAKIGKFAEAVAFYETANKTNPNNFQFTVKLANAYFDSNQFEKAGEFYDKALQINPNDVGARTDFGITFVERANPDYDRAIKEFETSLETDPKHEPTLYNLSVAYFKMGDFEKSQNALKQLESANPNSKLIEKLKKIINPA